MLLLMLLLHGGRGNGVHGGIVEAGLVLALRAVRLFVVHFHGCGGAKEMARLGAVVSACLLHDQMGVRGRGSPML